MPNTPSVDPDDVLVGKNIQSLRRARGMTQAELADALSRLGSPMSQQVMVKIEQGRRPVRFGEARAIARALKVPLSSLSEEDAEDVDYTSLVVECIEEINELADQVDDQLKAWVMVLDQLARLAQAPNYGALSDGLKIELERALRRRPSDFTPDEPPF